MIGGASVKITESDEVQDTWINEMAKIANKAVWLRVAEVQNPIRLERRVDGFADFAKK